MIDRRTLLAAGWAASAVPLFTAAAQPARQVEDSCQPVDLPRQAAGQLCNAVNDQVEETIDFSLGSKFNYQTRIYGLSSANPVRDPPSHAAKKIQHWWLTNFDVLTCNSIGFTVRGGSLLKLVIARDSNNVINDVTRRWGLWLNGRDFTGLTALDFIESEMVRSRGTPNENIMRRYQGLFQRFGAKRAADLTPADRPVDPFQVELRPLVRTWDRACYFNEGLAAVKRGGAWGYVNPQGQVVVPPRYDGAFAFSQGRAAVNRDGRWGYVDATGREAVPLRFADARVFGADGFAEVTMDGRKWTRIGLNGSPA